MNLEHFDDDKFRQAMKVEIEPYVTPVHELTANLLADLESFAGYSIAKSRGWSFYEFVLEPGWVVDIDVIHSLETGSTVAAFNGRPVYAMWTDPGGNSTPCVLTRGGWKRIDQLSCPEILLCCAADSPARAPKITEVPEPKYRPEVSKPEPKYDALIAAGIIVGIFFGFWFSRLVG